MGKAVKTPRTNKPAKPKQHAYYVCQGGTCTCDGALVPAPVPIKVTSQNKFFILGGQKLIATDKDNTNANLDFGMCKNQPPGSTPKPCKNMLKITWDKFYKDVTYDADHKHPLLDISEGLCKGYNPGKPPVKIKIANHGQTNENSFKQFSFTELLHLGQLSPLVPVEALDKEEAPVVDHIALAPNPQLVSNSQLPVKSGMDDGKITQIDMEIPRTDQTLNFRAIASKGSPALISWNKYGPKNGETKPSFDNQLLSYIEYGNSLAVTLQKNLGASFRIEAFGFDAGDENHCLDIHVRPNELLPIKGFEKGTKNIQLTFVSGYLFGNFNPLAGHQLHWKITGGTEELYNSLTGTLHGAVTVTKLVPVNSIMANFANAGKYTITALDPTMPTSVKTLHIEIVAHLGIASITHPANYYLRPSTDIGCRVSGYSNRLSPNAVNPATIEWRVYYGPNGTTQKLNYVGECPYTRGTTNFQYTPEQIKAQLHLPSVKGCYGIEAYGEHPTRPSSMFPGAMATGGDRYTFEVADNRVSAIAGPAQLPSGSSGTFKATTIMETDASEKNAFVWEVSGGAATIDATTGNTQETKITFTENKEYTVKCHMAIDGSSTVTVQTTVAAANLKLASANWCYNDGYLRTQAGYGEECYAYVELGGIKQADCKLQVWAMADGHEIANAIKDPKYLLQELALNLMPDTNRTPATAHGYATFKPDKLTYQPKIQAALGADAPPLFAYTITLADGGGIQFGAGMLIDGCTAIVYGGKTYYTVLAVQQKYLALTDRELIKAIYFTDTQKQYRQTGQTTYGNTHGIRVHTVGLAGQKITVKVYHEIPGIVLDSGYKAADKTLLVADEKQSFDDQKVPDNGTFSADFVVKAEWKDSHPDTDPFQTFVLEVLKKTRDAEGHDQINLLASQYRTNDALPFELLRPVKQIGMKFLQTDLGTDNESLVSYRRQYLVKENALLVTRNPAPNTAPQPSPTIVTFEDLDVESGDCERCKADITVDILKKIYRSADSAGVNLAIIAATLNKYKDKFQLDNCARKAHFFAQSSQEVGLSAAPALKGESLNYAATALPLVPFTAFQKLGHPTEPNELAYKYGRSAQNGNVADERMIANISYGTRLGNLGGEDGWNFRGRGLLQTTGRANYTLEQKIVRKTAQLLDYNIIGDDDKGLARDLTEEEATLLGMADWFKDGMFSVADDSYTGKGDDTVVDKIVDIINSGTKSRSARKAYYRGGDYLDEKGHHEKVELANCLKTIFKVAECTKGKGGKKLGDGKWHDPVDNPQLRGWYGDWNPSESKFGIIPKRTAGKHQGFDLYAQAGTQIYACVSGEIVQAVINLADKKNFGNFILLQGIYGGKTYYFLYGHLSELSVKKGDKVTAGFPIGKTGKTGNAHSLDTYQEHLHFEVRTKLNVRSGLNDRESPSSAIAELNRDSVLIPQKANQPK